MMEQFFQKLWYQKFWRYGAYLLLPLSCLYWFGTKINAFRQKKYFQIPIVVIGNLTAGGSGKTPVLIALTQALQQKGFKVGIISRGYKSLAQYAKTPILVPPPHSAALMGDEPLLIFEKTQAPLSMHPNRNLAIQALLTAHPELDLILSDDGLQNAQLDRDLEIVVIGSQGFGNGLLLPAGPLRESTKRLNTVDFCIQNGQDFKLQATEMPKLKDKIVHAVAGIANPERFFNTLEDLGFKPIRHIFPDHHAFVLSDFKGMCDHPIIMTEKDWVKCRDFNLPQAEALVMEGVLDEALRDAFLAKVRYTVDTKKSMRNPDEQKST